MAVVFLLLFTLCFHVALAEIEIHEKLFLTEQAIGGSYIVVLNDNVSSLASVPGYNDSYVKFRYDAVLNGYALEGVPDSFMAAILDSDLVQSVYEDGVTVTDPILPMQAVDMTNEASQPLTEPWGLDRIDSRTGLDGFYDYYATGKGVTIFIADGGIRSTHNEFTGRFVNCTDFTGESCATNGFHGTHVGKLVLSCGCAG
jgi:aqualysin 1